MRTCTSLVVAVLVALCAGCGGSGGDDGVTAPPSGPITLGSRGVPGGTVAVSSAGAITAGTVNTFRLVLDGGLVPTQVTAWIGSELQNGEVGTSAIPTTNPGTYEINLLVPQAIPASSHVRVRLGFADGSVIETGADDFLLNRP